MPPEFHEIDEVSQALDYLADQSYNEEQINLLRDAFNDLTSPPDYEALKTSFPGQRGIISRLRVIFNFCDKHKESKDIISDLSVEIKFLIASLQGEEGGTLKF